MTRRITYEWVVEWIDAHGDIIECRYWDEASLDRALADRAPDHGCDTVAFGLCRRSFETWGAGAGEGDETGRSYAYFSDGQLPEEFDDGASVPKRFTGVQA